MAEVSSDAGPAFDVVVTSEFANRKVGDWLTGDDAKAVLDSHLHRNVVKVVKAEPEAKPDPDVNLDARKPA